MNTLRPTAERVRIYIHHRIPSIDKQTYLVYKTNRPTTLRKRIIVQFSLFMFLITSVLTAMFSLIFPPLGHGLIVLACTLYMWTQTALTRSMYLLWAIAVGQAVTLIGTLFSNGKISPLTHGYFLVTTSVAWLIGSIIASALWKKHRPAP